MVSALYYEFLVLAKSVCFEIKLPLFFESLMHPR